MNVRFLTGDDLEEYHALGDPLFELLGDRRAAGLTGERWLLGSAAKRMVTWAAYEPLLNTSGLRVLDVGGGFSSLSFLLAERHDYFACDLCAHDQVPDGAQCYEWDWWDIHEDDWAMVLAVDLFPNVDQRLDAFLRKFASNPLRLALTVYEDRWYQTRRIDGDEILTMQAWDWSQTQRVLNRHFWLDRLGPPPRESVFPNGRQVCLVTT